MTHISLFEFTQIVRKTLEKSLDPTYWIVAEIGELRMHPKGHCYLELIEKNNEQIAARMKATIWSYTYQNLHVWFEEITGTTLKTGMKVLVNAEVQFHESFGLSLNIKDIDANYTLGEKLKLKQQVINRLKEEGLINKNRSLELPLVPQNIAIISSAHSAGYEDFLSQLKLSEYKIRTSFFPAEMQGVDATKSVVKSLKDIFSKINDFDLVVVLRGGGAQSDLDCFDTYLMGKAIARFPIPVVTGIGHERDESVADIVARVKSKTPTAAAEFIIDGMRNYETALMNNFESLLGAAQHQLLHTSNDVHQKTSQIKYGCDQRLILAHSKIELNQQNILSAINHHKKDSVANIKRLKDKIQVAIKSSYRKSQNQIDAHAQFFHFSDPLHTLQRGFTYTTIAGKPLHKSKKPLKGDTIKTRTVEHTIKSTIEEVN